MPRDLDKIAFEGSQERAAFENLVHARPDVWGYFDMGEGSAIKYVVPRIRNGVFGGGISSLDECVRGMLDGAMKGLRQGLPHEQADEDECFAFRLGFMTAVGPVRDKKLGTSPPTRPAEAKPLPARRLTPADFGCLPMPGPQRP